MLTFLRLVARVPLLSLYHFFAATSFVTFDILRWRRALTLSNLHNAFPEKSPAELVRIARQSYRNLGQVVAEALKGAVLSSSEIRRRVHIVNPELITRYTGEGRPVILLASHHCNWEWLLLSAGAQLRIPVDAVYKPQSFAAMDTFLRETRSRFGGNPIAHKSFLLEVMKRGREARVFALVADQTPIEADEKFWTRFLNQDTAFYVGPDKIARMLRAPVVFVGMRRLRRGYYEAELSPLAEPPYGEDTTAIIERYAHAVEAQILSSPSDWLWLHRKWKYKKPAYA